MTPNCLFRSGNFILHSGAQSWWDIDCNCLTDADWQTLARMAAELVGPFGAVEGVPTGGLKFAAALKPLATQGPLLIADDVLSTGASMEEQRAGREAIGVVVFARGAWPTWVKPLFACGMEKRLEAAEKVCEFIKGLHEKVEFHAGGWRRLKIAELLASWEATK